MELPIHNMVCSRQKGWEVPGKTCPFSKACSSGGSPPGVGFLEECMAVSSLRAWRYHRKGEEGK